LLHEQEVLVLDSCPFALLLEDGLFTVGQRLTILLDDVLQNFVSLFDVLQLC
jgi:hypothetical protein